MDATTNKLITTREQQELERLARDLSQKKAEMAKNRLRRSPDYWNALADLHKAHLDRYAIVVSEEVFPFLDRIGADEVVQRAEEIREWVRGLLQAKITKQREVAALEIDTANERLGHPHKFDEVEARLEAYIAEKSTPKTGKKVFVVHGHDLALRDKVVSFLGGRGLDPVVLDAQGDKGLKTLLTKFLEHAPGADFAVICYTADDLGAQKDQKDDLQPRARENVVWEFGYFVGKLTPEKVFFISDGTAGLASDFAGTVYIPYKFEDRLGAALETQGL